MVEQKLMHMQVRGNGCVRMSLMLPSLTTSRTAGCEQSMEVMLTVLAALVLQDKQSEPTSTQCHRSVSPYSSCNIPQRKHHLEMAGNIAHT